MFGRTKTILGLDIGSYGVRAVEVARSGGSLTLVSSGKAKIEGPEAIEDTIQKVLSEAGIRTRSCVSAVSGRSVIVRYLNMMPLPDAELSQAIRFEADKTLPFEVEEGVLDWQRVEEGMPGEQIRVLYVSARRSAIDEHVAMLDRLGLSARAIDVDALALGNAFEARSRRLGINDEELRGLVDIGASKTNINIMKGNTSCFAREIYIAGNDLTHAIAKRFGEEEARVEALKEEPGGAFDTMKVAMQKEILREIGNEIRLSFEFYLESQADISVQEIYLSGGSVLFPEMDRMLEDILQESSGARDGGVRVDLWNPMDALDIPSSGFDVGRLQGANSDMAIAVGLATRLAGL